MITKLKRIVRKLRSLVPVMRGTANVTFSQFGEDFIMLRMLGKYNVDDITYLDIGAFEPIRISNTYGFYLRGHHGVLVEPNAALCAQLKKVRPRDTVLNFGIGVSNETQAEYYMFDKNNTFLNTFSKEEALNTESEGIPIKKTVKLPLKNINEVIAEHFDRPPTILSLDVEGLDEMILQTLDFEKHSPLLICVETVNFSVNGELLKRKAIIDFLLSKGYFIYADTHINTIFCSRKKFDKLINQSS